MAIDPNNPPVNSRVISTVRTSTTDLTANEGGLNVAWAENGVAGSTLPGFYFGRVTDPQGTVAWTFVGGYGISTDSSDRLVIGDGTRIVYVNGGEECSVRIVNPAAGITVGNGDATIVFTGGYAGAGAIYTVDLPAASVVQKGRIIIVKEGSGLITAAGGNTIRIQDLAGTIQGAASADITTDYGLKSLLCTGTEWVILGSI